MKILKLSQMQEIQEHFEAESEEEKKKSDSSNDSDFDFYEPVQNNN